MGCPSLVAVEETGGPVTTSLPPPITQDGGTVLSEEFGFGTH